MDTGKLHFKSGIMIALTAAGIIALTQAGCKREKTAQAQDQDQVAYDAADGITGGRLYDHFISETNMTTPAVKNKPNFFRCKSCHGWDLQARQGHLINMAASANYPVVASNDLHTYCATHSVREIFDAIKNKGGRTPTAPYDSVMPDYSTLLTDTQIWQLVKFLKTEANTVTDFYDPVTTGSYPTGKITFSNIGKGGNAVAGKTFYDAQCKSCHGDNGALINIYCQGDWLGNVFRDDPFELQHKAKFGMPMDIDHTGCSAAGSMVALPAITAQNIKDLLKMGQDTTAFPSYH